MCELITKDFNFEDYSRTNQILKYISNNIDEFICEYLETVRNKNVENHAKKLMIILFNQLFSENFGDSVVKIDGMQYEMVVKETMGLFQEEDISLVSLSAELSFNLLKMELINDFNPDVIIALVNSLEDVNSQFEIYGLCLLLSDLSSVFFLSNEENSLILSYVFKYLSNKSIDKLIKIQCLSILRNLNIEDESIIPNIINLLLNISTDFEILSSVYLCLSELILNFSNYCIDIFSELSVNIFDNLTNCYDKTLNRSICYFLQKLFDNLYDNELNKVIPKLLSLLLNIIQNYCENDLNDYDDWYLDDVILDCINSIIKSSKETAFLFNIFETNISSSSENLQYISLISLFFSLKYGIDMKYVLKYANAIFQKTKSKFQRIRLFALKCLRYFIKYYDKNKLLYIVCSHLNDIIQIQEVVLKFLFHLALDFDNIQVIFDIFLEKLHCNQFYIECVSREYIILLIKYLPNAKIHILFQKIINLYEDNLNKSNNSDIYTLLCTIINSISMKLNQEIIPYSDILLKVLQKTFFLCKEFELDVAITLSTICYCIGDPFRENIQPLVQLFINKLQNDYDENVLDSVLPSLFFLMQKFNIDEYLPTFLQIFIDIYNETKNLKIISAISDIIEYSYNKSFINFFIEQILSSLFSSIEYVETMNDNQIDDLNNLLINLLECNTEMESFIQIIFNIIHIELNLELETDCSLLRLFQKISIKSQQQMLNFIHENNEHISLIIGDGLNNADTRLYSKYLIDLYGFENIFG